MGKIGWLQKPLRFALLGLIGASLGAICGEALIWGAVPKSATLAGSSTFTGPSTPTSTTPSASGSLLGIKLPPPVELPKEVRDKVDTRGGEKGDVEIALLWKNKNDLDLHCVDPKGDHIFFAQSRSPSGGFLDIDQNREYPFTDEPIEHIRWKTSDRTSLLGTYRIYIDHYAHHGGSDPTEYTVYLKYPGQGTAQAKFQGRISYSLYHTPSTPQQVQTLVPIATFTIDPPPPPPLPLPQPSPPAPSMADRLYPVLITALWTLLVAVSLSLLLVIGQNRSTNRGWISPTQATLVIFGAGLTGLIAGGGPEWLYGVLPDQPIAKNVGQVAGWSVLGGLLGLGMSRFIPNLAASRAGFAGLIGGAFGAIAPVLMGDSIYGRVGGGAILGFAIGLMVALVEAFVREAWLVLQWGPKEESTVNLGATPVLLGTGRQAQVRLPGGLGIPAEWATISLDQGKIELRDKASGKVTPLKDGSELRIGSLKIVVRATGSARK